MLSHTIVSKALQPRNCGPPGSSVQEEYFTGWPFLSPGDLPDPGIEIESLALQADPLPSEPLAKPNQQHECV